MTALPRIAWTERPDAGDRLLLVVDLRPLAGVAVGAILIVAPFLAAPLGRLSAPFALLVTLPPLALALEAFGWRDRLAVRLASIRRPLLPIGGRLPLLPRKATTGLMRCSKRSARTALIIRSPRRQAARTNPRS